MDPTLVYLMEGGRKSTFREPMARFPRKDTDLRLIPLGFVVLIATGTLLLVLPWAHQPGASLSFLDALFLSTSAACVTGLSTVNVAETFNLFGQVVLLMLIQLGGLGILTAGILLVLVNGSRLTFADEQSIQAAVGKQKRARPFDVFIYACLFVLIIEVTGALALFLSLSKSHPGIPPGRHLWEAVFHAVSAFCNAGFSIYPEGLLRWNRAHDRLLITSLLVIAGGIGLMTLINLRYYYFWRRDPRKRGSLTLQSKVSLVSAAGLLVAGTVVCWLFEIGHTLKHASGIEQLSWSFFHSAMTRTAGFNTVDVGAMDGPTLLVTIGLMFIGGAPGSMAGGIKSVTFVVLILTAWSALRRRDEIQFWHRRLPSRVSFVATMVSLLSAVIIVAGFGLMLMAEQGQPAAQTRHGWLAMVYEVVSAFGTVGLSTGVTPLLTPAGKGIIIALMLTGRIAPLMLAMYLARPLAPIRVRHPREELAVG